MEFFHENKCKKNEYLGAQDFIPGKGIIINGIILIKCMILSKGTLGHK